MKWIKIWTKETLLGTTFTELNATERGIWFSLLVMAGDSEDAGYIYLRQGIGYEIDKLSYIISVDKNDLQNTIEKLVKVGKITVNESKIIIINKWEQYQDNYYTYGKKKTYLKQNFNKTLIKLKKNRTQEREEDKEVERDKETPICEKPANVGNYELKTDIQKVIAGYKIIKGFAKDDRDWDKLNFARCSKSAKKIIDSFSSGKLAIDCIQEIGLEMDKKGLTWTLETIVKWVSEYKRAKDNNTEFRLK